MYVKKKCHVPLKWKHEFFFTISFLFLLLNIVIYRFETYFVAENEGISLWALCLCPLLFEREGQYRRAVFWSLFLIYILV